MKRQTRHGIYRALALFWFGATVCWAGIDKAGVNNIAVAVDTEHLDQFAATVSTAALSQQIAKNLAAADFPVHKAGVKAFTHTLTAHFSRVSRQSTPAGFSFSAGNSDPRASEFQKADVLTVKCVLQDRRQAAKTATETMAFSAGTLVKMRGNALANALADHASSTCYSLLENLHLEQTNTPADNTGKRPHWMPNIRIEVKNVAPPSDKSAAQTQPANAAQTQPADEGAPQEDASKKELIIHNRGTPVIFKLGHERR